MASLTHVLPTDARTAKITRVVPGRSVYIADDERPERTEIALRLDDVLIEKDGVLVPYGGEPFTELNLRAGTVVKLIHEVGGSNNVSIVVEFPKYLKVKRAFAHMAIALAAGSIGLTVLDHVVAAVAGASIVEFLRRMF